MNTMLKPIMYICIVLVAMLLGRAGLFKEGDSNILSKIVMNFTLPAAIVVGVSNYTWDTSLFWLIPIGLICGLAPLLIMFLCTKRMPQADRVYYMINLGGMNVGCFAMPIVQCFFGAAGTIFCCMFDMGNAVMMTSGSYAITSTLLHTEDASKKISVGASMKNMLVKFFTAVAFDVYVVLLLLAIFHIQIPESVGTFLSPIASSNAFLSMFMVGLMVHFEKNQAFIKDTVSLVALRLLFSTVSASILYFATPFSLEIRQVLTIVAFAPIGSLCPVFVGKCHGDMAKSGCANSLSILCSFIVILILGMHYTHFS